MESPLTYYQKHLEVYTTEVQRLFKKMALLSTLRVLVFLATTFGVYMMFDYWQMAALIGMVGMAVFLYVLSRYNDVKAKRDFNAKLIAINEEEIKIASGDFHHRDGGLTFQDPNHFYSLDIDLFGRGSFFQFINRTAIDEGTHKLANTLKANNTEQIALRQEAIKELSSKPEWRQFYTAKSNLVQVDTPAKHIIHWLESH